MLNHVVQYLTQGSAACKGRTRALRCAAGLLHPDRALGFDGRTATRVAAEPPVGDHEARPSAPKRRRQRSAFEVLLS
jgi:hypothetical protein